MTLGLVGSWVRVHHALAAGKVLAACLIAGCASSSLVFERLGSFSLSLPVSAQLLVPIISGIAVAISTEDDYRLPLPGSVRLVVARLLSVVATLILAIATCSAPLLLGSDLTFLPLLRNCLLGAGLCMVSGILSVRAIWFPMFALTLAAMLFGADSTGRVSAWAVSIKPDATWRQVGVTGLICLFGATLVSFNVRWGRSRFHWIRWRGAGLS